MEGREWQSFFPEEERAVYAAAGYGADVRIGSHPALLVIDATVNFTDVEPKPILESMKKFPNSCGEGAWTGLEATASLLAVARELSIPIVYTHGPTVKNAITLGGWSDSKTRGIEPIVDELGESFVDLIKPSKGDLVLEKMRPSAFFGTPLAGILTRLGVDSVIVTGGTTSGCVRATVIDAFSSGFMVAVAEEATFDRTRTSHLVNLFEMNQKYAQVLTVDEIVKHVRNAVAPTV